MRLKDSEEHVHKPIPPQMEIRIEKLIEKRCSSIESSLAFRSSNLFLHDIKLASWKRKGRKDQAQIDRRSNRDTNRWEKENLSGGMHREKRGGIRLQRERERGKAFAKDSWKHAELLPCWSPSAIYNENIFTMPNHCYYVSIDIYLGSHLASTSIDLSTPFSPLPLPLLGQRINARRNCHVRKNNFRNHYQFRGGQSLLSILSFIEFRSDSSDLLSIRQEEFTTEVFHSRYFPAY